MKISDVFAYQIYDSRGNPTVEAGVRLENGMQGFGLVPSGASTGQFEAIELRDGNNDYFCGRSVEKAVSNVQMEIADAIVGQDVRDQSGIDRATDAIDSGKAKTKLDDLVAFTGKCRPFVRKEL